MNDKIDNVADNIINMVIGHLEARCLYPSDFQSVDIEQLQIETSRILRDSNLVPPKGYDEIYD